MPMQRLQLGELGRCGDKAFVRLGNGNRLRPLALWPKPERESSCPGAPEVEKGFLSSAVFAGQVCVVRSANRSVVFLFLDAAILHGLH